MVNVLLRKLYLPELDWFENCESTTSERIVTAYEWMCVFISTLIQFLYGNSTHYFNNSRLFLGKSF